MSERTIICVLGMHRSGTSLFSRLLNLLGVDLGFEEHMIKLTSVNPAGYWESRGIKEINDEILEHLGGSWLEPPELPEGWERSSELAELRRQARALIEADFSSSDLLGFKDPRNCLTLPFWQRILGPMRYVICLRNPVDVAASLEAREDDGAPFEQGVGLWLTYTRAAVAATAGHPREFMFYEDLMADPEAVASRLARFIGQSGSAEVDATIELARMESLWHHRTAVANVVDTTRVAFHVKAFYLALRQFLSGPEAVGIDAIELFGGYAAEAGSHLSEVESALEEAHEKKRLLEQELAERSAELDRARESYAKERLLRRRLEAEVRAEEADVGEPEQGRVARARYGRLVDQVRARAEELIPSGATVLVAAKGDDALLELNGSHGLHFPFAQGGDYAGHHPAGDTAVIAQLEAMRARGADHLVLPATTLWWLKHYQGLRRHLEDHYVPLLEDDFCAIYRLTTGERKPESGPIATLRRTVASIAMCSGRDPSILDWSEELRIAEQFPELPVFAPSGAEPALPYLDGTVDVVVLDSADAARIAEARRVAASAVIRVDPNSPDSSQLEWLRGTLQGWGVDVGVTLLADSEAPAWEASRSAFAETLGDGFAGVLSVVGADAGANLAERARAAAAAGDHRIQAFVTAPAIPLEGWLPPILSLFSRDEDAGVIGARTVSGDGTLRAAGGVLASSGTPQCRGEGDHDPDSPEYCFVKRVDFCSPPLLVTTRDVFERLAGFDERRATPAEAMLDFSLRAGRTGAHVYYQPHARLVALGDEEP